MSNQDPSDPEAASGESEVGKFDDFHPIETEEPVGTGRRIVVGIAASITLLVGALVVYNAFGTDEPGTDASGTGESVDPTLMWTEYTPSWTAAYTPSGTVTDQPYVYSVETVGDGRVLARAFTDTGTIIMISENGTDWTQAAVPHGISPDFIDVSGDRWLIAGHDATGFGPADRAFYSDSGGEDWTELALDEGPGDQSSIILSLASGQNMVIVFKISDDAQNPEEPPPDGQLMVYTSDGDTTTRTGEYVSGYTTGSSNAEGFHIVTNTPEEQLLRKLGRRFRVERDFHLGHSVPGLRIHRIAMVEPYRHLVHRGVLRRDPGEVLGPDRRPGIGHRNDSSCVAPVLP